MLDVNESFAKLYGQSNDKIIGLQLHNLYQTDTPELLRIKQLLLETGEKWQESETLARLTTNGETPITVVISHRQTQEQNETRYIYVIRDISQELDLIAHITEKNHTQELSEALVKMGYWRYDTNNEQLWCSNQIFKILGLPNNAKNLVDIKQLQQLIETKQQQQASDAIQSSITFLMPLSLSLTIKTFKGEQRHIVIKGICETSYGRLTAMYGVFQDITERKQKESQLHQFKQIIESSEQAISVFNAKGQLLYANPAHTRTYRLPTRHELCSFNDLVAPEYHSSELHKQVEDALKAQGHWSGEIQSKRFDRSLFPSHFAINQFEDPSNKKHYRFAISYDISAEKQQQQMLNQAKIKAEAANHAKSEFISNMSHELRTPLNAVLGFTQLLKRQSEVEFTDRIDANIDAIHQAGEHLLVLINGVLDLAKIESGNAIADITDVNIQKVINDAVNMISPVAQENGLSLLASNGSKIPVLYTKQLIPIVKGDYIMLKQALLNYLSNATKYNKSNGVIFVTVDINKKQQTARITVTDNGIGIGHDNLSKLFTPFNRLGLENSNIQGTGIGLVITKKNIEALGGTVGVTSKTNIGSSFWFELPYETILPIDPLTNINKQMPTSRNSVLYIDDNQTSIELMQGLFEPIPEVDLYSSVNIEIATIYAAQYQPKLLLISDNIAKQDVSGINHLVQRANLKNHHIIVISDEKHQTIQTDEFDGQLYNPVSFDALQTTLRQYKLLPNEHTSHD